MEKAIIFILLGLFGCSSIQQGPSQVDAQKEYRLDLKMTVNGIQGRGTLAVPKAKAYVIQVEAPGDSELVTVTTCHRETTMTRQNNEFSVTLYPTQIESSGYCPILIQAFSQRFKYAGGLVDASDTFLAANVVCNGAARPGVGASLCQSRVGMIEGIEFAERVRAATPASGCPAMSAQEGKKFEVRIGKGRCVYVFMSDSGDVHRLTTVGYEEFRL